MAVSVFTQEDCKNFVDDVFKAALGKDFDYVLESVKEKMIRDGETSSGGGSIGGVTSGKGI